MFTVSSAPSELDDAGDPCSVEKLEQCKVEGHKFVRLFIKKELEQRGKRKSFDKCK